MRQLPVATVIVINSLLFVYQSISAFVAPALLLPITFLLGALYPSLSSMLGRWLLEWSVKDPHLRGARNGKVPESLLSQHTEPSSAFYGVDHAILNVSSLAVDSMWMNMGYWKDETHLPRACQALLRKVLQNGGLEKDSATSAVREVSEKERIGMKNPPRGERQRVILDLGFGCGDQSLYLMNQKEDQASPDLAVDDGGDKTGETSKPLFDRYIGITIEKKQYQFAQERIKAAKEQDSHFPTSTSAEVFCADAANPTSWPAELRQCISEAFAPHKDANIETEPYVLALDTLYHFSPSRREIFKYAHSQLHANILAFDVFLAPQPRSTLRDLWNKLFLWALTSGLSTPFSNLLTPEAYRAQLKEAGYADEDIAFEDITDDVFPGLASFLERRQREIAALGLKGFTKWRVSGGLFRRLAAGDLLRAGVVVAKRGRDT